MSQCRVRKSGSFDAMKANYGSLPFEAQLTFFRGKLNMPTAAWTDIWQQEHARAFVVAGAMREDLLNDLRGAVDKAIEKGTTLAEFRKDFDKAVQTHGWSYSGGRGWRTRVIYDTNLRSAHAAGRYKQMQAVKESRPFWMYKHSVAVEDPRPEHLGWDSIVLPADHPFWETHFGPNGWGCQCRVIALNQKDLDRLGLKVSEDPHIEWEDRVVGLRGLSPRTVRVPKGIDPGWAYNPGKAAWGEQLSADAMSKWDSVGTSAWSRLTPGTWQEYARPDTIPLDKPIAHPGASTSSKGEAASVLRQLLHGDEKVFKVKSGGFNYPVLINANVLADHLDLNRSPFLPFLIETLNDPFEVWTAFEKHQGTGQIRLRTRFVKGIKIGKGKHLLFVANARGGVLEGWTYIPMRASRAYMNSQREGLMIYGREK